PQALYQGFGVSVQGIIVYRGAYFGRPIWVVNPPLGHPLLPAQNFIRDVRPNLEDPVPLLAGIDMSGVYFQRVPQVVLPGWATADLLATSTGSSDNELPLVFSGTIDQSQIVVWAFDLEASNLPARLALPLLTANTLSTLLTTSIPAVIRLGEPVDLGPATTVELPGGRRLTLSSTQDELGESRQFTRTKQPGLYRIYNNADQLVAGFAVQAGSALEANPQAQFSSETVTQRFTSDETTTFVDDQYRFWPWLIGVALFVIMIEGWLAWRRS
ncbi:MAG: hypothetical protein AAF485_30185, partial [Chloroflexota bacterium]